MVTTSCWSIACAMFKPCVRCAILSSFLINGNLPWLELLPSRLALGCHPWHGHIDTKSTGKNDFGGPVCGSEKIRVGRAGNLPSVSVWRTGRVRHAYGLPRAVWYALGASVIGADTMSGSGGAACVPLGHRRVQIDGMMPRHSCAPGQLICAHRRSNAATLPAHVNQAHDRRYHAIGRAIV
jgi:hypothetical protein